MNYKGALGKSLMMMLASCAILVTYFMGQIKKVGEDGAVGQLCPNL
jgi:hypothetical protein